MSDDGHCNVDFEDYSDDADPVEFHQTRFVLAKKAHTCSECRGVIAKGEQHRVTAYKFEGTFGMDRLCACCLEAADEFRYFIMGGDLWAMFREEWDRGAHLQSCLNRLTTARAKEHMRQQWVKWNERRLQDSQRLRDRRKALDAVRSREENPS